MREFIRRSLTNAFHESRRGKNDFQYQLKRKDGDIIDINGTVTGKKQRLADFTVSRTKANGHRCSSIPVQGMPLTDDCISQIVEMAAENL